MAYDQSSAYQAPGRPYYPQNHQAPVQKPYGGYHAQQPQYDDYAQSYDHGYGYSEQQYGGYHGYGHDMNQQQGQYYQDQYYQDQSAGNGYGYGQYDQGYPPQDPPRQDPTQRGHAHQASGRPPPPNDAHGGSRHNGYGPQDRTYDPRYQQRPGRGAQPPPNGSKMQRPPPNQDHSGRPPPSRGQDPRNGHPSERSAYPPGQQGHDSRNGRRERGNERGAEGQPVSRRPLPQSNSDSHQAPSAARDPKKSAMEEWKANERAKMHDAASKPKTIPQDNAFPTFPANQKEEKRSAGHGSKSARPSEDHPRPSTSSARSASRPGSSKSNQAQDLPYAQNSSGGQAFEQPHSTRGPQPFSPIQEQPIQDYQQQYMQEPAAYAYDDNAQQQWQADPQVNHEGYQAHGQPPMRNDSGHQGYGEQSRNRMPPQAPRGGPQQPYSRQPTAPQRVMSPPQMQPQGMRRPPPPQQAPSSSTQASSNGPMSVPPYGQANGHNPSVNPRAMPAPQAEPHIAYRAQETSHYPDSGASQPYTQNGYVAEQNSSHYTPQATHEHSTLDDVYDEYYGSNSPEVAAKPAPPKNREEEIEAEMPDFDSAAPGQTSSLHKRQQTDEKHANGAIANGATPPPSQNVNPSVQSLPVQTQQPYVHQQEAAAASQPEFRDMNQGQGSDGFVFGVPGEQVRPVRQDGGAQQMPPRQQPIGYRPVQSVPPEDMRRHQSPADGRQMQMPMRGGPPGDHPQGQRFHPGGRGPLPPQQQRSASTRPPMAQGGWSDPGQQRAPTAPPMRQDSRGAHPHGVPSNGGFPDQHRAPSAPPAQQDMRGMPLPGGPRNGAPPNQQQMQSRPPPQQQRPSDPDSLPHHPTPFRPGLADHGTPQPPKPAPVRNYDNRSSTTSSHARQPSMSDKPITKADLDQARADMEASPASPRLGLRYAKKLVEASHVLASEGGRLDAKTTQRNREKYLNEAYKRVKDLVRNAYPDAQFYMAECYGDGELGLTIDPKEAFALYQAAAKGGHAAAAFRTAVSCEIGPEDGGGTRKDHPKAVQWYRRAAALGDPAAMFKVGIMSLRGLLGVPRNVGEAFIWLKRAAERADKDNPHALHELATLHDPTNLDAETRAKVPADEPLSLSLFRRAADFGFKRSQYRLGQAYEYGLLGLEIDNRASIAWYTKAAAQGEHNAELALSGWYLTGADGMLDQSDMEAYLWARKAAQSEPPLAKAMFAMGYFTEQGIGCPKSLEEAKRWYGRAASFQFPRALERLEELRKGGKSSKAVQGKLTRDKKKDEENCAVM